MKYRLPTLDVAVRIALGIALVCGVLLSFWVFHGTDIIVTNIRPVDPSKTSPLTGLACAHPDRRPVAVMVASDPEARPLSGLAAADIVFEMPVTPNGITRMMAVYQCGSDPVEIGSIRSARQDFIPLAQGMDAILAHWGGEHAALDHLNAHVIDNVDALIYEGTIFYRKSGVPRPHNGFTTLELIRRQGMTLGYAPIEPTAIGYEHQVGAAGLNLGNLVDRVSIPWPQHMGVEYRYDSATNLYARNRGGTPELDKTTGQQIKAGVVIVMDTDASFLRDQYISVRTTGQGTAAVYQNGTRISAVWKKTNPTDMLQITTEAGATIPFATGQIWVEVDAPLPSVSQ